MARSPVVAFAAIGMLLCFALGYLLGSETQIETAEIERNQASILAQLEALASNEPLARSEALTLRAGDWAGPRSDPSDRSSQETLRLPDLDPWIERIDKAIASLEKSIDNTRNSIPASTSDLVSLARDRNLPRHDSQLHSFVREVERVEQDFDNEYDRFYEKHQFRSFASVLEQYGRPDELDIDSGVISMSYTKLVPGKEEQGVELWHAYFDFRDGILVDFGGHSNSDESY